MRNALAGYIKTFDKTVIEPEPAAKAAAAPTMTYEDAQLQEKIAKARIAELELQEKEGALVSRERINAQLFAAGKELRDTLLAIPDRITDVVMAEDNRAIIHNTIYDAIADALQKTRGFSNKDRPMTTIFTEITKFFQGLRPSTGLRCRSGRTNIGFCHRSAPQNRDSTERAVPLTCATSWIA